MSGVYLTFPFWNGQSPLHPRRPPTKFAAGWATRPPAKPAAPDDEFFVIICRHSFLICHSMLNSKVTISIPAVATVPRFPPKGPVNPLLLLLGRRPGLPPGGGGRLPGGPRPRPRPPPLSPVMWIRSDINYCMVAISSPAPLWKREPRRHCQCSKEYSLHKKRLRSTEF